MPLASAAVTTSSAIDEKLPHAEVAVTYLITSHHVPPDKPHYTVPYACLARVSCTAVRASNSQDRGYSTVSGESIQATSAPAAGVLPGTAHPYVVL